MGQVLRRAAGRVKAASCESPPPQPRAARNVEADPRPRAGPPISAASDPEALSKFRNESGILEERDPGYDAMLGKMVGRITSKPGGKLEMGEAFIVERYNRPMPKLRSSGDVGSHDASKPTPPGTVDIKQLREIFLLYEGKSKEHQGTMSTDEIARKFGLEPSKVQKLLHFGHSLEKRLTETPKNNTNFSFLDPSLYFVRLLMLEKMLAGPSKEEDSSNLLN